MERSDTIAAISTPSGAGAVAVIRISGSDAGRILREHFVPARKGFPALARDMSFGRAYAIDGSFIDEAIALFMKGPESFTGEDVAEIQCHGGPAVSRAVLSTVISAGARSARPGEFSRRAFINGKMSLLKAESTLALIEASTERGRAMASGLLDGSISSGVYEAMSTVRDLLAKIEAVLDWPDEMADEEASGAGAADINGAMEMIRGLIGKANNSRLLIEGIRVAIIGRPNMGKSSILNRLLGHDRAMVSDIPGTTRDTVEETANVEGIPIRFADTAGIGPSGDALVEEGIRRARKAAGSSSVIVYVAALPEGINPQDAKEISKLGDKPVIVALNKADLADDAESAGKTQSAGIVCVSVSAKTGYGIDRLRSAIARQAEAASEAEAGGSACTRWIQCLEGCLARLADAKDALDNGAHLEAVCLDIRDALFALGELSGDTASEDIISVVFDKFCIGK